MPLCKQLAETVIIIEDMEINYSFGYSIQY